MPHNQTCHGSSSSNNMQNVYGNFNLRQALPLFSRTYSCAFCEKTFKTRQGLGGHMKAHTGHKSGRKRNQAPKRVANVSATAATETVQSALEREQLRQSTKRGSSSSSQAYSPYNATIAYWAPQSYIPIPAVTTQIRVQASQLAYMYLSSDAVQANYHTMPFHHQTEKRLTIETDALRSEISVQASQLLCMYLSRDPVQANYHAMPCHHQIEKRLEIETDALRSEIPVPASQLSDMYLSGKADQANYHTMPFHHQTDKRLKIETDALRSEIIQADVPAGLDLNLKL